jgi:hypothetical protein
MGFPIFIFIFKIQNFVLHPNVCSSPHGYWTIDGHNKDGDHHR